MCQSLHVLTVSRFFFDCHSNGKHEHETNHSVGHLEFPPGRGDKFGGLGRAEAKFGHRFLVLEWKTDRFTFLDT